MSHELFSKNRCVIVIPTFNERENIARMVLGLLLNENVDLLFVDDSSPDGTQKEINHYGNLFPGRIHLLSRATKDGLGKAYLEGFKKAVHLEYGFVGQMDADGSHRADDFFQMFSIMQSDRSLDCVVGSRWVKGGSVENWPKRRVFLSKSASLLVGRLLALDSRDVTSGFKIFKRSALQQLMKHDIQSVGYCFQIEIALIAKSRSLRVIEFPIKFPNREFGVSKINFKIIAEAGLQIFKWFFKFKKSF